MRAKETSFTSTLRDLEDVRLAKNKEADRAGARVWLIEHCALLTELELGVGPGGTDQVPVDFLSRYAINIVKETLTRDTAGFDAGASSDFLFPAKGRGTPQTARRIKELKARGGEMVGGRGRL